MTQSVGGFWTNAVQIALKIDATATQVTVPANEATYVGTMYASANGQCTQQFKPTAASGGSANILGLWNAYNRLRITSLERDSTNNWSMNITNWGAADASASNKITWIDGLQQSFVEATSVELTTIGNGVIASIGVGLNTITATPNVIAAGGSVGSGVNNSQSLRVTENFPPQLGLNYISAMELASSGTTTVTSEGAYAYLQLSLEM